MGTRSLICVFYNGRFVVAQYSQWNGDPEGQGLIILNFLLNSDNIERLKNGLQHIITLSAEMVEHITTLNHEMLQQLKEEDGKLSIQDAQPNYLCCSMSECARCETTRFWPSLSRDTGAGILEIIAQATVQKHVPVVLELGFANDRRCEWTYVVDLDSSVLEVYSGAESKEDTASKRFICVGGANDTVPALVKSFPFAELPETQHDFIEAVCVEQDLAEEDDAEESEENDTEDDGIEDDGIEEDSMEDDSIEEDGIDDNGIDSGSDDDGIEDYGIEDYGIEDYDTEDDYVENDGIEDGEDDDTDDGIEQQWIMPKLSF